MENPISEYKSRFTTILTLIGMAVGLGNVWRFPYMMGSNGGSAFLLVYLAFTLLLAIPALMAEMHLGKKSKKGTIDAFQMAYGEKGKFIGYLIVAVITLSASYYGIIVGNVFFTTAYSGLIGFSEDNSLFSELLSNAGINYATTLALLLISLFVVSKGLNSGIERVSRFIMPFFLLSLIYIIIHSLTLPGSMNKVAEFLQPDFNSFGISELFAAIGQTFFSVGLGGSFVIVYSGYMSDRESIPTISTLTGLGDLGASLLISMFLVPAVLVLGLEMNSGPTLIFQTLPELFFSMSGGRFIGTLFLTSISLVAWLSLIAAYEVVITSLSHVIPYPRKKIIIAFAIVQSILILPSVLEPRLIGILDLVLGSGMQVFGGLMAVIGVTWFMKEKAAFKIKKSLLRKTSGILYQWTKWIVTGVLSAILISYIYQNII